MTTCDYRESVVPGAASVRLSPVGTVPETIDRLTGRQLVVISQIPGCNEIYRDVYLIDATNRLCGRTSIRIGINCC